MTEVSMRHLAILRHMPRHPRKLEASEFTRRLHDLSFSCTKRTVERDLERLAGLWPIYVDDRSKPYGWQWDKDSEVMDIPGMDVSGALAFQLAHEYLEQLLPPPTLAQLAPHFNRAKAILKEAKSSKLKLWPDKVRVIGRGPALMPPKVAPGVHDVVFQALLENKRIDACYRPRDAGQTKEYVINPLGAVFRQGIVYIVGTLWEYDDIKQFSLHRFTSATLLDELVKRPKGFDLDRYVKKGEFSYPASPKKIRLRVAFDQQAAQHLYETPLSKDQKLTLRTDGRVLMEATVNDTAELRWWLLGFGSGAEVLSPSSLRNEFKLTIGQLAALYTSSNSKRD